MDEINKDNLREFLDSLISDINSINGDFKMVRLEDVAIENCITKRKETIPDLVFIGTKTAHKSELVTNIQILGDDVVSYQILKDLDHANISNGDDIRAMDLPRDNKVSNFVSNARTIRITTKYFCSPIHGYDVYTNPQNVDKFIRGFISKSNVSDGYRSPNTVNMVTMETVIRCSNCGTYIKVGNKLNFLNYATRLCPNCIQKAQPNDLATAKNIQKELLDDPTKRFVRTKTSGGWQYKILTQNELRNFAEQGKLTTYYPSYCSKDVEDEIKIPMGEKDVLLCGAGSANSTLAFGLSRLTYLEKYSIVDFDKIEKHNLSNQFYDSYDVGYYKTTKLAEKINRMHPLSPKVVETFSTDISLFCKTMPPTNYKYVILGFDNLEARKFVVDHIKTAQLDCKYLIDLRYDGQTSSLFIVDTSNEKELEYYKAILEESIKAFEDRKQLRPLTTDERVAIMNRAFSSCRNEVGKYKQYSMLSDTEPPANGYCRLCDYMRGSKCICAGDTCRSIWQQFLDSVQTPQEENSCTHKNNIGIYLYTNTFVINAIKSIEEDNKKPFTHVELSMEETPTSFIVRK